MLVNFSGRMRGKVEFLHCKNASVREHKQMFAIQLPNIDIISADQADQCIPPYTSAPLQLKMTIKIQF